MQPECLDRLSHSKMEYYRDTYKNSERWNGDDSLDGKTVIVYCEQGFGDNLQFVRYIPRLKEENCKVVLHCSQFLHRLFEQFEVEQMIDRDDPNIPDHDYHIPSMSLPFHFDNPEVDFPYLSVSETTDISDLGLPDDAFKIGIGWEGNPEHSNNDERCCCLRFFKEKFQPFPQIKPFVMQKLIHDKELIYGCENMELYGSEIGDFYDTAKLINAMDLIITVDTSILHLAGAMNKKTIGLLSFKCDPRWDVTGINWYPSVTLHRQKYDGDWQSAFDAIDLETIIG